MNVQIRNTRSDDFEGIIKLSKGAYPNSPPWKPEQLASHIEIFPEGQFVAEIKESNEIVGMSSSLIISWEDYEMEGGWRDFTDHGYFRNHDPEHGRTLYGAEIIVNEHYRGRGIGSKIYRARQELVERLGLLRIRAGARLRGYHKFAETYSAEEYAIRVVRGEIHDPTLSFQIHHGFHVLAVVSGYLRHDSESLGYAAVIEWLNPALAKPEDWAGRNPIFNPEDA
jgi:ribosomal protein S18 acetylase RimI-like enzyme